MRHVVQTRQWSERCWIIMINWFIVQHPYWSINKLESTEHTWIIVSRLQCSITFSVIKCLILDCSSPDTITFTSNIIINLNCIELPIAAICIIDFATSEIIISQWIMLLQSDVYCREQDLDFHKHSTLLQSHMNTTNILIGSSTKFISFSGILMAGKQTETTTTRFR